MYKNIQLTIPVDENITRKIVEYKPEEIIFILEIGINCYEKGKKDTIDMSEVEVIKKIKQEYENKLEKMENVIINEKECRSYIIDNVKKMYEDEKNDLIRRCEKLETEIKQLKKLETDTVLLVQKEVDKAIIVYKEKMNIIIDEKNRSLEKKEKELEKKENDLERDREFREKYREDNAKILHLIEGKNNYSNMKEKGDMGEILFNELSDDAFGEIEGYELKDTSTIKHSGDFHLHFKDFGILVDLKNYDTIVPLKEVLKIENDFKKNSHLKFAWLISLNTRIQNNDKGIFTYKITDDGRCICYVNEMLKQTNPIRIIKSLYYFCKTINVFIKDNTTDDEINEDEYVNNIIKKNYKEIIEEVTTIKKEISELNSTINTMKGINDRLQFKINNILKREIDNIMNETKHSDLFDEWFYNSYEVCESEEPIKSRDLWVKFKKENPTVEDLDMDKFKELICDNVPKNNLIIPKNKKGSFDIINYKVKKNSIKKPIDEFKKAQKKNEIFSNEEQQKILDLYCVEEKDIMEIKDIMCIKNQDVYKIVSFLILSNVIASRSEARGYEKYKETDEYKNKINLSNNVIIIDNNKK